MNPGEVDGPQITFKINPQKQEEAILWLVNNCEHDLTKYFVLKILFYAEKYHLNKYGRPVIGDELSAMFDGPVPSKTYDLIKDVLNDKVKKAFVIKSDQRTIEPLRSANKDYLSESDIEALKYGLDKCKNLSFIELKEMSHKEPDYLKAWNARGGKGSNPIDLKDSLDPKTQTQDSKIMVQFSNHIKV